jgi:hypothetical protein
MKSVILILLMATNVIAFEQIYAINAGGEAHTDSDGIVYRGREERNRKNHRDDIIIGNVPVRDREIYHNWEYSEKADPPLRYEVPLKTDGLYLLIAKLAAFTDTKENDLTLNNEVQLLTNVDLAKLCGSHANSCDKYFYFCVIDRKLYYQNQSTLIQNAKFHIEINSIIKNSAINGLVLLKGTFGERQKLLSSNTDEFLDFDPKNMDPRCSKPTGKVQAQDEQRADINCEESLKNITDLLEESRSSYENTQLELEILQTLQDKNSNLDSCYEMSWKNLTELLNQQMDIKFEKFHLDLGIKTKKHIEALQNDVQQLAEIQRRSEEKTLELETEIKTSIAQIHESNNQILTQQIQIYNQSTERMDIELSELTTKTNQANKNFEKLQFDVQQLIEIQQKSEPKMTKSIETINIQNESVKQLNIKLEDLQSELTTKTNQATRNFEKLQSGVQQLAEVQQKSDQKTLLVQAEMKKSIAQIHESNNQILTQQMQIHNQSTERMDIKLSELTTNTNQANKNFEKLQFDVQQLLEIQQRSEPRMTTSIEKILQTSNEISTQQSHIQNESAKQLNIKFKDLHLELQSSVQQLAEVQQKSDQKTLEVQAEMKKSIERNQESSNQIFIQQMHIHNSMSELAYKSNQANKNFEALQASVQQLVDDNQKMRAEIKQLTGKLASAVPAEEGSLKAVILEITSQLNDIREVVLTNAEAAK